MVMRLYRYSTYMREMSRHMREGTRAHHHPYRGPYTYTKRDKWQEQERTKALWRLRAKGGSDMRQYLDLMKKWLTTDERLSEY